MKSGYHQVAIKAEDKLKTAFTAGPLGFFEYNRLPFGLSNAPATYQKLMEEAVGDLNHRICEIFLDDVIVFASTYEEHLDRLSQIFAKFREAGMKLSPKKCHFCRSQVRYVGHIVSEAGIQTDPEKTAKITHWKAPHDVDSLRSYIGFCSFYRRYVPNFAKVAKPLNELLVGIVNLPKRRGRKAAQQGTKWKWDKEQQEAFDKLKTLLTSPPILCYPDFDKPYELHVDASGDGLGAVLYQEHDGRNRVVCYASRALARAEKNYSAFKLEFLCLKWAITQKYHDYLYGCKSFTVFTDNNPLTYVLSSAKLDATGQRWVAALASYNFSLHYKPGNRHSHMIESCQVALTKSCHLCNEILMTL